MRCSPSRSRCITSTCVGNAYRVDPGHRSRLQRVTLTADSGVSRSIADYCFSNTPYGRSPLLNRTVTQRSPEPMVSRCMPVYGRARMTAPNSNGCAAMKGKPVAKRANFVSPNDKAKSEIVAQLVRIARKARLGYEDFLYVSQQARRKLGLRRGRRDGDERQNRPDQRRQKSNASVGPHPYLPIEPWLQYAAIDSPYSQKLRYSPAAFRNSY